MPEPTYLTLATWGGTSNGWPQMTLPAVAVQVHHSVTNEDIGVVPTDDAIADFLELDRIGLSRGHGGISYSHGIHPNGIIGEGQGTRRGAHTAGDGCNESPWGWNPCTFGIVFVGNFDPATGGDEPTPAAINSFRWLIAKLKADGVLIPDAVIRGHRDAPGNATGCPGDTLEAALPLLRAPYTTPTPAPTAEDDMLIYAGNSDGTSTAYARSGDLIIHQFHGPGDAYGLPPGAAEWANREPRVRVELVNPHVLAGAKIGHDKLVRL